MPIAEAWEIVTEVEPEWDDQQRDRMQALAIYEAGVGPCGFHHSLTADKTNVFTFDDETCSVCRGVARYGRMQAKADRDAMKQYGDPVDWPAEAYRPSDGRMTSVRMMDPLEVAARRQRTSGESSR